MVGIVVVAHSAKLAESTIELGRLMMQGGVQVAAAGGTDDPENIFGTNAFQIQRAIEAVFSDDGVLVLMDMGSAILSAETALEFLNDEQRSKVYLCEAPLVEGTIAAIVCAGAGGTIEEVITEARGALAAKAAQLQIDDRPPDTASTSSKDISSRELALTIHNSLGLHARPAARFVATANKYKSQIYVRNIDRNTPLVSARSINSIFTLGVLQNHQILIRAEGPDAEEALLALGSLVERNFDEDVKEQGSSMTKGAPERYAGKNVLIGEPVAQGIAVGPAIHYLPSISEAEEKARGTSEEEWQRFLKAIESVKQDIKSMQKSLTARIGVYEAEIFDSHLLCLNDPSLLEAAKKDIDQHSQSAETAWENAIDTIIKSYRLMDDPYLRSRNVDLVDLKIQVIQALAGKPPMKFKLEKAAVLIAPELRPSDISNIDSLKLLGVCTAGGAANSHSAILARALDVPVIFGLGMAITAIEEGTTIVVNGNEGSVLINPENIDLYKKQQQTWRNKKTAEHRAAKKPAITMDGKQIEVTANIANPLEAHKALLYGAEGIGLLRSEFLFLNRQNAPSEEEQVITYRNIAQSLADHPIIIRTLDIGGDKNLPYLHQHAEDNPSLGERGIRFSLNNLDIFKIQLKAILRAGQGYNIKIMLPMVATIAEIKQAKEVIQEVKADIGKSGEVLNNNLELGIMIEVPSAVLLADRLAKEVDFFSIGTNDLIQYTMAADRNNSMVKNLGDAFHPAVLRLIRQTALCGKAAGIPVAVCGEMAGNPMAIPLLIGMGIDKLSVNLPAIADIKRTIARLKLSEAEEIASRALECDSSEEVKGYLR